MQAACACTRVYARGLLKTASSYAVPVCDPISRLPSLLRGARGGFPVETSLYIPQFAFTVRSRVQRAYNFG